MNAFVASALVLAVWLEGCTSTEPLDVSLTGVSKVSDQAVIAEAVGKAQAGAKPMAWANPTTGSAGVIENIDTGVGGAKGCRSFTSTMSSMAGNERFDAVACPSDGHWKLSGPAY